MNESSLLPEQSGGLIVLDATRERQMLGERWDRRGEVSVRRRFGVTSGATDADATEIVARAAAGAWARDDDVAQRYARAPEPEECFGQ